MTVATRIPLGPQRGNSNTHRGGPSPRQPVMRPRSRASSGGDFGQSKPGNATWKGLNQVLGPKIHNFTKIITDKNCYPCFWVTDGIFWLFSKIWTVKIRFSKKKMLRYSTSYAKTVPVIFRGLFEINSTGLISANLILAGLKWCVAKFWDF